MTKIVKLIFRITAIVLVFGGMPLHILIKYGGKTTETVPTQITTGGLNSFWTIVLVIVAIVFLMWVITGMLVMWWDKIKASPFGYISVFTFGTILCSFSLVTILGLGSLITLIETNSTALIANFEIYKADFQWFLGYTLIGTLINVVLFFVKN